MTQSDSKIFVPILLPVLALLVLAACGRDEPTDADDAADVVEETVEAVEEPVPADEPADEAEAAVEVVEESATDAGEDGSDRILLARAETPPGDAGDYQYEEGTHYARLVPTQPTVGGADKIEVGEFFWYGCPHCFDLEPTINEWAADAPANVRFVRIPAMWNPLLKLHAQLYYTEEVLGKSGALKDPAAFHQEVFKEYHSKNNRLASEDAIRGLFERFGVSAEDFNKAWGSFEVAQKMRVAEDLARRYSISSVPTIVVNGKYRTGAAEAGSYPKLIEVIDELVDRESTR
ncbi:MAG TPA: thiol:disulfide interchange protein DsbA/DsbL [Woeseiaceae bacterium]|nr:thiol:disulfide interchange protein DsbA/DsbL [Woeseiaceae bacterium]